MRTFAGSRIRFVCCSVVLSSMLAACGGSGSSGSSASSQTTPQTPVSTGNTAPTITGTAQASATVGKSYYFTPSATDADKDAVTFTIANKPAWATFNATTGALTGTPATTDVGNYAGIEIAATDGKAVTALPAFAITVGAAIAT